MKIYLDWAATAPPDQKIAESTENTRFNAWANPASSHSYGRIAAQRLETARKRCSSSLGLPAENLYFTSGGTEADQLPLLSLLHRPSKHSIAISAIEHPAVREQARMLARIGWTVITIPCDSNGIVTPEAVTSVIRPDTVLVSVMAVNNETGAAQPIAEISKTLKEQCKGKRKILLHVDAVQAVGKTMCSASFWDADSIAVSAHKLGGPRGIGLLYLARPFDPFIQGGGQEKGIRSGTVNVEGAWALSLCLEQSKQNLNLQLEDGFNINRQLLSHLVTIDGISVLPESRIPGDTRYSPWIIKLTNNRFPGEVFVRMCDEAGLVISTGSACSSGKGDTSVLEAMRIEKEKQTNAFRISFGPQTTIDEIDVACKIITAVMKTTMVF